MKCKVCGGTGTSNTCVNGTFKPCTFCDGTGEYEPFDADIELDKLYPTEQTEQEYIQTCNTEQLAEFLTKVILDDKRFRMTMVGGVNETKLWLKQPHKSVTVETRWDADDIKTPPFTQGQKKIIQATEKLAEKGKYRGVDGDL